MIVVEPKTTQSVEPNEESVDLFSSTGQMIQKLSLSSTRLFNQLRLNLNRLKFGQRAVKVQQSPAKY